MYILLGLICMYYYTRTHTHTHTHTGMAIGGYSLGDGRARSYGVSAHVQVQARNHTAAQGAS